MSFRNNEFKVRYTKAKDDIAAEFYLPCMKEAKSYDRISGYFRSTIFVLIWEALKSFVNNGGKMRFICSPYINTTDQNAVEAKQRLLSSDSVSNEFIEAQKKSRFCSDLRDLMDDGLQTYRNYLKQQVEEDATRIFLNLSSDPSYIRLKINDNYGLNIVHESGQIVTVRSAGFEHIVALALIGALHNNAPLQGPVVMDSPFGRLDSVHEKNIIQYLPKLANQVMLFVFDKEIDEQNARHSLGSDLIQEYELLRGDTFETTIRRK